MTQVYPKSNILDTNDKNSNMYGCQPCPSCGDRYRYPMNGKIHCDNCGQEEDYEDSGN